MNLFRPLESLLSRAATDPQGKALFYDRWYTAAETASLILKAATFLSNHGFGRDAPVPMLFRPSLEAVILLYATQAIGGYAVPFSSQQPQERILEGLQYLGTRSSLLVGADIEGFTDALRVSVEDFIALKESQAGARGEFYCQFHTSGTTGTPKSVRVTQSNIDYLMNALMGGHFLSSEETFLFSTTWIFDVSTVELLFWPFASGRLVIPKGPPIKLLKEISSTVNDLGVTHLNFSPSAFNNLSRNWTVEEWRAMSVTLRRIFFAGEELKVEVSSLAKSRLPGVRIFNCYGPTECTVYASIYECSGHEEKLIPIGKSLNGARVEIKAVSVEDKIAADVGEVVISGEGVAPGYFRADPHSESRFIRHEGHWSYTTGDLARLIPSGDLVFMKRLDRQVQVNGIRVELGEIESILDRAFEIAGSTRVVHVENGLVAFFLGTDKKKVAIREIAGTHLPSFSRPTALIALDEFPLTPNGKADDRKLRNLADEYFKSFTSTALSQENSSKNEFSGILSRILGIFNFDTRVSATPLLELGLDSLDILSAIVRLENEFSINIPESALLAKATPESLGRLIQESLRVKNSSVQSADPREQDSQSLFEAGIAQVHLYRRAANALLTHAPAEEIPCHGFQRVYHFDTFESSIDIAMTFHEPQDRNHISKAVGEVVESVEGLKVGAAEGKRLLLRHCNMSFPPEVPRITVRGNRKQHSSFLAHLSQELAGIAKTCEPNNILHAFLIVSFDDCVEVLWSLSHLIADAGSQFVLKQLLTSAVKGLPFESKPFSEYVRHVDRQTDALEVHQNPFTAELLGLPRLPSTVCIVALDKLRKESLKFEETLDRDETIARISHEAARLVSRDLRMDEFGISTIINLRDSETFDAGSVIGDCHGSVVIPYRSNCSFESLKEKMRTEIGQLRAGRSPHHAAFSGLPQMSQVQRELEEAFDSVPILGINFLGFVARADISAIERDLSKFRQSLEAFPANRIYATAFQDEHRLVHLYFLNWPTAAHQTGECSGEHAK